MLGMVRIRHQTFDVPANDVTGRISENTLAGAVVAQNCPFGADAYHPFDCVVLDGGKLSRFLHQRKLGCFLLANDEGKRPKRQYS